MEKDNSVLKSAQTNSDEGVFDFKKARLNVISSIIFKIILLVLSIISKRFLINYLGNEYNGLNSLFLSIIGLLGVADLGIGTAIIYCMYDPISKNNVSVVRELYTLFKKIYTVIGFIILGVGLVITPFLPFFANGFNDNKVLYVSYIIFLLSVVMTYFYSAKMSLINAYKNNYISTTITSIGLVIQYVTQIIVLVFSRSFILFCLCKILCTTIQLVLFNVYNKNSFITKYPEKINVETKKSVVKNVKAMFMHKMGDVIFGSVDSIVISCVISVAILGYYSNYLTILTAMNEILKLFIIPLTSIIGHMGVKSDNKEKLNYFKFFYCINFIIGLIFYLGYFATCSDLITIFFGEGLTLDNELIFVLSLTYFIQFMRQSASVFKDSFGLFYKDRWLALIAAISNAVLSIVLAVYFDLYGVLFATIIVDLVLYHIIEPFVLFKYGFDKKPYKYYLINYSFLFFFCIMLLMYTRIQFNIENLFLSFIVNGLVSVGLCIIPVGGIFMYKPFRSQFIRFFKNR